MYMYMYIHLYMHILYVHHEPCSLHVHVCAGTSTVGSHTLCDIMIQVYVRIYNVIYTLTIIMCTHVLYIYMYTCRYIHVQCIATCTCTCTMYMYCTCLYTNPSLQCSGQLFFLLYTVHTQYMCNFKISIQTCT